MKSIVVPVVIDSLQTIDEFINAELEACGCSSKTRYQVEVAIEEVVVNIVSYSQLPVDAGFEVRCEVLQDPTRLVVQILDGGVPFDPLAKPDPDMSPEALQNRIGGLGIYMVKQMMDEATYAYEDGKNVLTITKILG